LKIISEYLEGTDLKTACLMYNQIILEEECFIGDYGITGGSTLFLIFQKKKNEVKI